MEEESGFWSMSERQRRRDERRKAKEKRRRLEDEPRDRSSKRKTPRRARAKDQGPTWLQKQHDGPRRRRLGRGARIAIWAASITLALLLILALLGPIIAESILPGFIENRASAAIRGRVSIKGLSVSWRGPQRVAILSLDDPDGHRVAQLRGSIQTGLIALALGSRDLGEIHLGGSITISRDADASTNLQRAIEPTTPPASASGSPGAGSLPSGLAGRLIFDSLRLVYVDPSAAENPAHAAVALGDLTGSITLDGADLGLRGSLESPIWTGSSPERLKPSGARIKLSVMIADLFDRRRRIKTRSALFDTTATLIDAPADLIARLSGLGQPIADALGGATNAKVEFTGRLKRGDVRVSLQSPLVRLSLPVRLDDRTIRLPESGTLHLAGSSLAALVPALSSTADSTVALDTPPDLTLTLLRLDAANPLVGGPLDLRGASLSARIDTQPGTGVLRLPSDPDHTLRPFAFEAIQATLTSDDLAAGVNARLWTSGTLQGRPAGKLLIEARSPGALDETGRPLTSPPVGTRATLELTELAAQALQPMADAMGIDLARQIGPSIDLHIAATVSEAAEQPGTSPPPIDTTFTISASNLAGTGAVRIDRGVARSADDPIRLTIRSIEPAVERFLPDAGLNIESGGSLTLELASLIAPIKPLAQGRFDAASARIVLGIGQTQARVTIGQGDDRQVRRLELKPGSLTIDATTPTERISLTGSIESIVDAKPGGTLRADLSATGLLDSDGQLAGTLPALSGAVDLAGLDASIARPFLIGLGIHPAIDFGPVVNARIHAAPARNRAGGQTTQLDLTAGAERLDVKAALTLDASSIQTRGAGLTARLTSAGPLVARTLGKAVGLRVGPSGFALIHLTGLDLPIERSAPAWERAAARVQIDTGNIVLGPRIGDANPFVRSPNDGVGTIKPLTIERTTASLVLSPGGVPHAALQGRFSQDDSPFLMDGSFDLPGLIAPDPSGPATLDPTRTRPVGRLAITNIPAALVQTAARADTGTLGPLSVAHARELARSLLGPTVTIQLDASPAAAAGSDITLTIKGDAIDARAQATLSNQRLDVRLARARSHLTPPAAAILLDALAPTLDPRPTLREAVDLTASVEPVSIDLTGANPIPGRFALKLDGPGATILDGLIKPAPNQPDNAGSLGISGLTMTVSVPTSSSDGDPSQVALSGTLLDGSGGTIGSLAGSAKIPPKTGLAGGIDGQFSIRKINVPALDRALGMDDALTGALGQQAALIATLKPAPPDANPASDKPAGGGTILEASIHSRWLRSESPLRLLMDKDRFRLLDPMTASWDVSPTWATRRLIRPDSSGRRPATITRATHLTLVLGRLVLARGADSGPLLPGVFDLSLGLAAPRVQMALSDGTKVELTDITAGIAPGDTPGSLGIHATINPGAHPSQPTDAGTLDIVLRNVADERGRLTRSAMTSTISADLPDLPSPILDSLLAQNGLLVDLLGPTLSVKAGATELSRTRSGDIGARATSQRVEASLSGRVIDNVLHTSAPMQFTFHEITPELSQRFTGTVPILGRLEKKPEDGPAVVTAEQMTIPLPPPGGGPLDMRKLNGLVTLELGPVRFETGPSFTEILSDKAKSDAQDSPRTIERVQVTIKDGVATYERMKIPLGNRFIVQSEGRSINLVTRQLDVVTWIPLGALSEHLVGEINKAIGGVLGAVTPDVGELTLIPIRTSGTMDSPRTGLDVKLLLENVAKQLSPDQLLKRGLGELLKRVGPKKGGG